MVPTDLAPTLCWTLWSLAVPAPTLLVSQHAVRLCSIFAVVNCFVVTAVSNSVLQGVVVIALNIASESKPVLHVMQALGLNGQSPCACRCIRCIVNVHIPISCCYASISCCRRGCNFAAQQFACMCWSLSSGTCMEAGSQCKVVVQHNLGDHSLATASSPQVPVPPLAPPPP